MATETTTLPWAPPTGPILGGQEGNERWHHGGDRQIRLSPGCGVGDKGRKQVTEVSEEEDLGTGRRAQSYLTPPG